MNIDHVDWAYTSLMHETSNQLTHSESDFMLDSSDTDGTVFQSLSELNSSVPLPRLKQEPGYLMQCGVLAARSGAPLVVIDDDPTGTQTVHSVPVLADWSVETLQSALAEDVPCFYILSNTRALVESEAVARAEEIASNIRIAACRLGLDPARIGVVSRGDSTLRGHYPAETNAIAKGMGWKSPTTVIAPFFFEGGRLTAHDIHYVKDGDDKLVLASETEFAKDKAFGYQNSNLKRWVEEKSNGSVKSEDVVSLPLELIRSGGPNAVAKLLSSLPNNGANATIVVNALCSADMVTVALGIMRAEKAGFLQHGVLYRSAGAMVAARAAISPKNLLSPDEIQQNQKLPNQAPNRAGLVVVGSYVSKTSRQLEALKEICPWAKPIEVSVRRLAGSNESWSAEEQKVRREVEDCLRNGNSVCLYTSRDVIQNDGASGLDIGAKVNSALVSIVQNLQVFPEFLIAKGGITSNDIAVEALKVKRAEVVGCVRPGVPVWRLGPDSKAPGLAYVVFPGNVGAVDDLAKATSIMAGKDPSARATIPDLLREAGKGGYAVGAFNVYNIEGALAVQRAVERTQVPAIIQLHPASMDFGGLSLIAACKEIAVHSKVPILVQLDHASDEDFIGQACLAGVNGIMADGSHLSFDENRKWTKRMACLAHSHGISIEAELGKLAGEEDGLSVELRDAKMTDPDVVADFLLATQADVLAVTIGNVHGKYAKPPELDWRRLEQIRANATGTPLALHGASGLPDQMLEKAVRMGITKFNVNTEVRTAARESILSSSNSGKDLLDICKASTNAMQSVIEQKIRAFCPKMMR